MITQYPASDHSSGNVQAGAGAGLPTHYCKDEAKSHHWFEHLSSVQGGRSKASQPMCRSVFTVGGFCQSRFKALKSVVYPFGPNYVPKAAEQLFNQVEMVLHRQNILDQDAKPCKVDVITHCGYSKSVAIILFMQ